MGACLHQWEALFKIVYHLLDLCRQEGHCLFSQGFRNAKVCFGNTAGHGGDGVTVATDGNGIANGIDIVGRFQKGNKGLGHTALASDIKLVIATNGKEGEVEWIIGAHRLADGGLIGTGACQVNRCGNGFSAFDAFGMVVGH